jgi:uncharacterized damage-inducible protein DinB
MNRITEQFIAESRTFLLSDYLPKVESCLERLTDEEIWWRPNEESNSIGNLLMHLDGSTRNWIISVASESYSPRNRQQEFDERKHIPKVELLGKLRRTVTEGATILTSIDADQLLQKRPAASEEVTVLWAIYHAVEHFAMHTGQIIMLAKMLSKERIRLSD